MQLLTLLAIAFAIAAGAFALQNNSPVVVNLFFWSFESSLALVLLASLALGALILGLMSTPAVLRDRWQLGRQKKKLEELEQICERQGIEMAGLAARLPGSGPLPEMTPSGAAETTAAEESTPRDSTPRA